MRVKGVWIATSVRHDGNTKESGILALSQYEKSHLIKECDFTFCRQYVHSISLFLVKYFYVSFKIPESNYVVLFLLNSSQFLSR